MDIRRWLTNGLAGLAGLSISSLGAPIALAQEEDPLEGVTPIYDHQFQQLNEGTTVLFVYGSKPSVDNEIENRDKSIVLYNEFKRHVEDQGESVEFYKYDTQLLAEILRNPDRVTEHLQRTFQIERRPSILIINGDFNNPCYTLEFAVPKTEEQIGPAIDFLYPKLTECI